MAYVVTNQNLIICSGGRTATLGHRLHLRIYKDEDGKEYVYFEKQFQLVSALGLRGMVRETIASRGE